MKHTYIGCGNTLEYLAHLKNGEDLTSEYLQQAVERVDTPKAIKPKRKKSFYDIPFSNRTYIDVLDGYQFRIEGVGRPIQMTRRIELHRFVEPRQAKKLFPLMVSIHYAYKPPHGEVKYHSFFKRFSVNRI